MHQARAGRGVVGVPAERRLAEPQAEDDAAVARRHVGAAVGADPVRRVAKLRVLDQAEQVHRDGPEVLAGLAGHRLTSGAACNQLARLESGSVTRRNASSGPLMSVLGPGPCPNSMHCPVEMTPIVR